MDGSDVKRNVRFFIPLALTFLLICSRAQWREHAHKHININIYRTRTPLYTYYSWHSQEEDFVLVTELQNTDCRTAHLSVGLQCDRIRELLENSRDVAPLCDYSSHFSKRCSIFGLMNEKPEKALWSMESMKFLSLWERRGFSLRNSRSKLLQSFAAFCNRKESHISKMIKQK